MYIMRGQLLTYCMYTGELMTVTDALRHGFLDRGKKHFFNPTTRSVYSLIEAINNGWVHVRSNMELQTLPYGE